MACIFLNSGLNDIELVGKWSSKPCSVNPAPARILHSDQEGTS